MASTPARASEPEDLRRWIASRRAAEEREQREAHERPLTTAESVAAALSLFRLTMRLHGWPLPDDPVTRRENAEVAATWQRLRHYYGKP